MEQIIQVGGISAAAVVLVFGLYRGLLTAKIIPKLSQRQGFIVLIAVVAATFTITLFVLNGSNQPTPGNSGVQLEGTTVDGESTIDIKNSTGESGAASPNTGVELNSVTVTDKSKIKIDNKTGKKPSDTTPAEN